MNGICDILSPLCFLRVCFLINKTAGTYLLQDVTRYSQKSGRRWRCPVITMNGKGKRYRMQSTYYCAWCIVGAQYLPSALHKPIQSKCGQVLLFT